MAAPQHPFDLYNIDTLFNEEQLAIRDVARDFVNDRIKPHIAQWFEDGTIPGRELAKEMGQLGMLGMHLEGYGCAGASTVAYGLIARELERIDSGHRSAFSVQSIIIGAAIVLAG